MSDLGKSYRLTNAERETHLSFCADDRNTVHLFSDDPVSIKKFTKLFGEADRVDGEGHFWIVTEGLVRIRKKGKRTLTEEQREALAVRMRKLRNAT